MKRAPDPISKEEVRAILDAAAGNEEDYLFLRLLAKTGRRIGEIYSLHVKDLALDKREAYAPVEKKKRKQSRVMFLDGDTCLLLNRYITSNKLGKNNRLWKKGYRALQNVPKRYAKKAGINKPVMAHSFRHYVITQLRTQGWSWEDIAKITGHEVMSVRYYDHTDAYLMEGDFRKAVVEL